MTGNKGRAQTFVGPGVLLALGVILVIGYSSVFIVPEGRQAVLFQFGRIVSSYKEPGLHFKLPWRQIQLFEKRLLNWDGLPEEINTREKNNIIVDTTARYKIIDPEKFRRLFQSMNDVNAEIGRSIVGATNKVVADHDLVETVRNTNDIIEKAQKASRKERAITKALDPDVDTDNLEIGSTGSVLEELADAEIAGELETIEVGREKLTEKIIELASEQLNEFGLELVDIQLKRVALEESVEQNVYTRMITERERIVAKIKSVGRGEKEKIHGKTERELQEIQSEAYRQVQEIKGEAEGKALAIYASAVTEDPAFYKFYRSIQAYSAGLKEDSELILSSEADFLRFLQEGPNLQ